MKRWLTFFLGSTISFFIAAQEIPEWQLINEQVWEPYIEAYNGFRTKDFMALHTDDVIRVSRDSKQILVGTDYRKNQYRRNSISRSRDLERSIELRFLDRLVNENIACEVGYYRVVVNSPGASEEVFYGLFHVILKKVDGQWKIYVDSDEQLTDFPEEKFMLARSMYDY